MGMWGVGRLFFWAGKYPEAYEALQAAWQVVKDVPEIPLELGGIDLNRGHWETALGFLQRADELAPQDPDILLPLANAYSLNGQNRQALQILDNLGAPCCRWGKT